MIEVPSAALCAPELAREVAFFSIGTNDLIQYSIAVDRVNERIAHLYEPTHPAILRLIKMVVDAAHDAGIWAGVCGEMASEVTLTPLLLGLGVDELSAGAALVPRVKRAVQSLEMDVCRQLADEDALKMSVTPAPILAECESVARKFYPLLSCWGEVAMSRESAWQIAGMQSRCRLRRLQPSISKPPSSIFLSTSLMSSTSSHTSRLTKIVAFCWIAIAMQSLGRESISMILRCWSSFSALMMSRAK